MEVFDYELNSYLQSLDDSDRISGMIDRIEGCVTTAAEIMATKNIDPDVLCPEDYPLFAQEAIEALFGANTFGFTISTIWTRRKLGLSKSQHAPKSSVS
jgi:hypothetical protein